MFVCRRTFVLKIGYTDDDVRELIKLSLPAIPAGLTRPMRFYEIQFGPWNQIAQEAEFETLAECERLMGEWDANLSPEFWKKWNEVRAQGGSNEVWTLIE